MEVLKCQITAIKSYGAFVNCGDYDGLLHISEISEQYVNDISNIFQIGDVVNLAVLEKDERYRKMKLSYIKNHPIHDRIRRHVSVRTGFNSLKRNLDNWIEIRGKDNEN